MERWDGVKNAIVATISLMLLTVGVARCEGTAIDVPLRMEVGEIIKLSIGADFDFSVTDPTVVRPRKVGDALMIEAINVGQSRIFVDSIGKRFCFFVQVGAKVSQPQKEPEKPAVTPIAPLVEQVQRAIGLPTVQVRMEAGKLVLEGNVASEAERERAERIALQFSPKGVINNIVVVKQKQVELQPEVVNISALTNPVVMTAPGEGKRINVELPVGVSMLIEATKGTIEQVAIGNPELVGVMAPSKLELLLVGRKEGQTNVIVWERVKVEGAERLLWTNFWLHIITLPERRPPEVIKPKPTVEEIRMRIEDALNIPTIKVSVYPHDEGFVAVLRGEVETDAEAAFAEQVASLWATKVIKHIKVKYVPVPIPPEVEKAKKIRDMIGMPQVEVRIIDDKIVLTGKVKRKEERDRAEEIAKLFGAVVNQIEVEKPKTVQQVMVEVRVLEVSKTALDKLGVQIGEQITVGVAPGAAGITGVNIEAGQVTFGETPQTPPGAAFGVAVPGVFTRLSPLAIRLNMLIEKGLARLLARPQQFVLEGTDATFLVGGMVPIPVAALVTGAAAGALGGVQFAPFGIMLTLHPRSTDAGEIFVHYRVESSAPDYALATTIYGARVPGFRMRRHEDRVLLRDGDTLVISGLIQEEDRQAWRRLPFLSSIPIIGELFKSREFQRLQSELVITMTVRLFDEVVSEEALQLYEEVLKLPPLPAPAMPAFGIGGFGAGAIGAPFGVGR
ncbi:MAG: BON domain-containing protein [Armatimonadota bacterium]|nr:BON domain-containing protein [Armatimonadota bacterium]MCX7777689.1 BON domain-containing protein [Armatimonadota bacterium]MDW8025448.1 BON domain-containing protein [Armatimonadota bacterium]